MQIYAPDVPTLEAASAQLIYSHKENGWQLSVPPAYDDEVANEVVFNFSETLISKKSDNPYAHNSSFAVLNHSAEPQAVEVSVYDTNGKRITSKSTPVLVGGFQHPVYPIVFPRGVDAYVFEPFFGEAMFPQFGVFGNEFTGTLRFKGLGGGKISVVELRAIGRSMASFIGKAVKQ